MSSFEGIPAYGIFLRRMVRHVLHRDYVSLSVSIVYGMLVYYEQIARSDFCNFDDVIRDLRYSKIFTIIFLHDY